MMWWMKKLGGGVKKNGKTKKWKNKGGFLKKM